MSSNPRPSGAARLKEKGMKRFWVTATPEQHGAITAAATAAGVAVGQWFIDLAMRQDEVQKAMAATGKTDLGDLSESSQRLFAVIRRTYPWYCMVGVDALTPCLVVYHEKEVSRDWPDEFEGVPVRYRQAGPAQML